MYSNSGTAQFLSFLLLVYIVYWFISMHYHVKKISRHLEDVTAQLSDDDSPNDQPSEADTIRNDTY